MSSNSIVMPFGKYRGWKLEDIPSGYLKYAAENWDSSRVSGIKKKIVLACDEEWQFREKYNCHISEDEAEKT